MFWGIRVVHGLITARRVFGCWNLIELEYIFLALRVILLLNFNLSVFTPIIVAFLILMGCKGTRVTKIFLFYLGWSMLGRGIDGRGIIFWSIQELLWILTHLKLWFFILLSLHLFPFVSIPVVLMVVIVNVSAWIHRIFTLRVTNKIVLNFSQHLLLSFFQTFSLIFRWIFYHSVNLFEEKVRILKWYFFVDPAALAFMHSFNNFTQLLCISFVIIVN